MKDIAEAEEFYEEFLEVAPNDNTRYILKYKICKEKKVSLEEQIKILEEYKEKEFTERWSYELAKLYYQNGDTQKCLALCDEMVLWFSDGKYVIKALDLKNRMGMLTGKEKEKYDSQFIPKLASVEDAENQEEEKEDTAVAEEETPVIDSVSIDERDVKGAESFQEKISKGIRDIFNGNKKKEDEDYMSEEEAPAEEVQEELIKDISSDATEENVPDLEPEDAVIHPPKNPGQSVFSNMEEMIEQVTEDEIKHEQEAEEQSEIKNETESVEDTEEKSEEQNKIPELKMPELEIPESMKNISTDVSEEIEVPKAPEICLPGAEKVSVKDLDFNLEDTILAAATAQGINIPEEPLPEKGEEVTEDED